MLQTSKKQAALANTAFSILQSAVAIINGIVLVPFYLGYLTPIEYGAWLATGNVLGWLSLIDPGIGDLARQRVAMLCGARRLDEACSVIATGGLIAAILSVSVAALGHFGAPVFIRVLALPDPGVTSEASRALVVAGYATGLAFFATFIAGVIQSLQGAVWIGVVTLIASIILPITRVVLLTNGSGMEGLAWGMVAQGGFLVVASLFLLARRISSLGRVFRFDFSHFYPLLHLTLFTSIQRVASVVALNLRGVIVTRYLGAETNFASEVTRASIECARIILDKPISSFTPAFAHLKGEGDYEKIATYLLRFISIALAALALCLSGYVSLNGMLVELWLGRQYFLGPQLNLLIAVGVGIAVVVNLARGFLYAMGEIRNVSLLISILAFAVVAAEYIGLRALGLAGVIGLPLVVTTTFCVVGFPRTVLRDYLPKEDRDRLLWHVVMPLTLAALLAGGAGWLLQAFVEKPSWGVLVAIGGFEAVVFVVVMMATSIMLRVEVMTATAVLLRPFTGSPGSRTHRLRGS